MWPCLMTGSRTGWAGFHALASSSAAHGRILFRRSAGIDWLAGYQSLEAVLNGSTGGIGLAMRALMCSFFWSSLRRLGRPSPGKRPVC
jgi:hypothetical protein